MAKRAEIGLLQDTLKHLMAAQGLAYTDMASHLEISLSTAKRLLNGDDPSLEKLLGICSWLGVEFHQVLEMSRGRKQAYSECTLAQEEFLAAHLGHLAFLRLLQKGQTPEQVAVGHSLSRRDTARYLQDLERHGFLSQDQRGKVRLLVNDGMDWRVDGPLRRALRGKMLHGLVSHYDGRAKHGEESFLDFGHKVLTAASYQQLKRDLDELSRKYGALSRLEPALYGENQVRTYSYVMLFDDWISDLWTVPPLPA